MSKKLLGLFIVAVLLFVLVPAAMAAPPSQGAGGVYTIQADDELSKIAEKMYGDVLVYNAIVHYNNLKAEADTSLHHLENPNDLEAGWKIYLLRQC